MIALKILIASTISIFYIVVNMKAMISRDGADG